MAKYARHVHLDFHTTELLAVGERFDKEQFKKALKDGAVNSIVVFAKCHHGWCYYPTKIGVVHPKLKFDLMGEQIKACREAGVRVVAYITGAWSASDAVRHPEWQTRSIEDGHPAYTHNGGVDGYVPGAPESRKPECTWPYMCMSGEYGEHIKAIAREVLDNYDIDGLFFDIMALNIPCGCESCRADMARLGYSDDEQGAVEYTVQKKKALFKALHDMTLAKRPDCTIFFNSGGADIDRPEYWEYSTHFEMENLASHSPEGYDAIVNRSKFFRETGKVVYGMTGKFHTEWGEFGGFKHPDALLQECMAMAAYGVRCDIGDQLHPSGQMNEDTYKLIGRAYKYIEKIEEYIERGQTNSRLGVMPAKSYASREGYAKLLSDSHIDYRLVVNTSILPKLDCVIIPSSAILDEDRERALCEFYDKGGKLVLFGRPTGADKLLQKIGYTDLGESGLDVDYIDYKDKCAEYFPESPILMYQPARRFKLDGEVLADLWEPYFSRTEEHYCSHRNTPNREEKSEYPAIVLGDRALCFAHEFGEQYYTYGNYWCRVIFEDALTKIYDREIEIEGLPVFGRYTMYRDGDTLILHLLGMVPLQRRRCAVVEEPVEIRNVKIALTGIKAKDVVSKPDGDKIDFKVNGDKTEFAVEALRGHKLIVIELEK